MHTEELDKMSSQERDEYERVYNAMRNPSTPRKTLLQALQNAHVLHDKYPRISSIYNHIYALNVKLDRQDEAVAVLQETVERFPDYLFGKIGLAEHYMRSKEYHKIPAVFDHKFELQQHFPKGTPAFHISEVISFYSVIGMYYAVTGDIAQALACYFMVVNVAPEHQTTKTFAHHLILADMDNKIAHQNHLDDFLDPETTNEQWSEDTIDDPIEAMQLVEQLQAHLPIIVNPTKHLIHSEVGNNMKLKGNSKLKVTTIDYVGDEGGIVCTIPQPQEILAVSLTHLLLDKKHPLYKYARRYQLHRIKGLASQQQYRTSF
jgi:tetratricopeptide (TPR) repeat protein